jgi:excisionase family DNA binding protein
MITLTPDDAELIADAVVKRSTILVDAFVKRLAARERVQAQTEKTEPRLLTYGEVGDRLKRTKNAVKMMVHRRELRAVHPRGGRRAYIDSRDLADYMESRTKRRTLDT